MITWERELVSLMSKKGKYIELLNLIIEKEAMNQNKDWLEIVKNLVLNPAHRMIAQQCKLMEIKGDSVWLEIERSFDDLISNDVIYQIQRALSKYYSKPIALRISLSETSKNVQDGYREPDYKADKVEFLLRNSCEFMVVMQFETAEGKSKVIEAVIGKSQAQRLAKKILAE